MGAVGRVQVANPCFPVDGKLGIDLVGLTGRDRTEASVDPKQRRPAWVERVVDPDSRQQRELGRIRLTAGRMVLKVGGDPTRRASLG